MDSEELLNSLDVPLPPSQICIFLEQVWDGDMTSALILADWLEEGRSGPEHVELAGQIRELLSPASIRRFYKEQKERIWRYGYWLGPRHTQLELARSSACNAVCKLFPGFAARKLGAGFNAFVRAKMREEGFIRRIMPLVSIDGPVEGDGPIKILDL